MLFPSWDVEVLLTIDLIPSDAVDELEFIHPADHHRWVDLFVVWKELPADSLWEVTCPSFVINRVREADHRASIEHFPKDPELWSSGLTVRILMIGRLVMQKALKAQRTRPATADLAGWPAETPQSDQPIERVPMDLPTRRAAL